MIEFYIEISLVGELGVSAGALRGGSGGAGGKAGGGHVGEGRGDAERRGPLGGHVDGRRRLSLVAVPARGAILARVRRFPGQRLREPLLVARRRRRRRSTLQFSLRAVSLQQTYNEYLPHTRTPTLARTHLSTTTYTHTIWYYP